MGDGLHFQSVFGAKADSRRICTIHVAEVYSDFLPFPRGHPRRAPLVWLIDSL